MRFKAIVKAIKNYRNRLNDYYNIIRTKCDISKMRFLVDAFYCHFRYNCSVSDYVLYRFYRLNKTGRKEYVTSNMTKKFSQKHDDKACAAIIADKEETLNAFPDFVKRDWLGPKYRNSKEECDLFLQNHSRCIVKPLSQYGGKGIRIVDTSEFDAEGGLYSVINGTDNVLVEELVVQCEELSRIYPKSVNTLRITYKDKHVIGACLRMGVGNNVVDNFSSGGIFADIDIESGIVCSAAFDKYMNRFVTHPDTGIAIVGQKIPFWKECISLADKVCNEVSAIRLAALDIAVTDKGPILIEINTWPDLFLHQIPKNEGLAKLFD